MKATIHTFSFLHKFCAKAVVQDLSSFDTTYPLGQRSIWLVELLASFLQILYWWLL